MTAHELVDYINNSYFISKRDFVMNFPQFNLEDVLINEDRTRITTSIYKTKVDNDYVYIKCASGDMEQWSDFGVGYMLASLKMF